MIYGVVHPADIGLISGRYPNSSNVKNNILPSKVGLEGKSVLKCKNIQYVPLNFLNVYYNKSCEACQKSGLRRMAQDYLTVEKTRSGPSP